MGEKKVLKFNHTNVVKKNPEKTVKHDNKKDNFTEVTNSLRNKLISKNNNIDNSNNLESNYDINSFDNAIKFLEKIRERRKKKK